VQKFLVVSYDDDQQQWFYDFVVARSADEAARRVCKRRPYVIDADATAADQLRDMPAKLDRMSFLEVREQFQRATKEA
jgi:hypothetical protein